MFHRGKSFDVAVKGLVRNDTPEGSELKVTVKLGLAKIKEIKLDLCKDVFNVECPVAKGPIEFVKTIDIPREIPRVCEHISQR